MVILDVHGMFYFKIRQSGRGLLIGWGILYILIIFVPNGFGVDEPKRVMSERTPFLQALIRKKHPRSVWVVYVRIRKNVFSFALDWNKRKTCPKENADLMKSDIKKKKEWNMTCLFYIQCQNLRSIYSDIWSSCNKFFIYLLIISLFDRGHAKQTVRLEVAIKLVFICGAWARWYRIIIRIYNTNNKNKHTNI